MADLVSDSVHVQHLEQFNLVHEALQMESPAITYCLQVLSLLLVKVDELKFSCLLRLFLGRGLDKCIYNTTLVIAFDNTVVYQVFQENSLGLLDIESTCIDV